MGGVASKNGGKHLAKSARDNDSIRYKRKNKKGYTSNCKDGNNDIQADSETLLEDTLITETEKQELVLLGADKNISIDFILEMKEAFLFSDKVIKTPLYRILNFSFFLKFNKIIIMFQPCIKILFSFLGWRWIY